MSQQIDNLLTAEQIADAYVTVEEDGEEILGQIREKYGEGPEVPSRVAELDPRAMGNLLAAVTGWIDDVVDEIWAWARSQRKVTHEVLAAVEAELWDEPEGLAKSDSAGRKRYCRRHFKWVKHNREVLVWDYIYDTIERERASWEKKLRTISRIGGFEVETQRGGRRRDNLRSRSRRHMPPPAPRKSD